MRDDSSFSGLLRRHRVWFVLTGVAGLALRLLFIRQWPTTTADGRLYAELAHSLLQTGHYLRPMNGTLVPSTARLPGYPAFLALLFRLFGDGNLLAVRLAQAGIDLVTALLVAWLAYLIWPDNNETPDARARAVRYAFALTALCPFLAMYNAAILTETTAVFCTVLALACGLQGARTERLRWWLGCGAALAFAIQLRPDSGLLLILFGGRLLFRLGQSLAGGARAMARRRLLNMVALSAVALAPVAVWTVRNAVVLHVFRPLVTTEATEVNEPAYRGFEQWSRTWLASYRGVEDFLNNAPGDVLDPFALPAWAFDGSRQRRQTLALIDEYNRTTEFSPSLDARFAALARERVHAHPVRSLLVLPLARGVSLWFSPRVEFLPIDDHWWPPRIWWQNDPHDFSFTLLWMGLNLLFIGLGVWGWWAMRPDEWHFWLLFLISRTAMLAFLGTCEPRYTLEAYPILLVWGACALAVRRSRGEEQWARAVG